VWSREQPPGRTAPDQPEQRSADLADRQQQDDKAEKRGARDPRDGEADNQQYGLDDDGANNAIGDAADRPRRDVERPLADWTAEPPQRVVQQRHQCVAIDPVATTSERSTWSRLSARTCAAAIITCSRSAE
jgi:hypothetical protein